MANLDYNIMSGIRPIQLESPQNQLMQAYQLKGAQEASQMNAMKMQEMQRSTEQKNRLRSAVSGLDISSPEANKLIEQAYLQEGDLGGLMAHRESMAKMNKEQTGQQKATSDLFDAKVKQSRQFLEGLDPNSPTAVPDFIQWHKANHADPVLGPILAQRGVTLDSSRARIEQAIKAGRIADLIDESKLGIEKFAELSPNYKKARAEEADREYSDYLGAVPSGERALTRSQYRDYVNQKRGVAPAAAVAPASAVAVEAAPAGGSAIDTNALFSGATPTRADVIGASVQPVNMDRGIEQRPLVTAPEVAADSSIKIVNGVPVSTAAVSKESLDPEVARLLNSPNPRDQEAGRLLQQSILAAQKPEPLTELGKLQRERSALASRLAKATDPAEKKQIKAEIRDYDKNIKLKTEEASGTGSIPVTPVTIVDPKDPTKTVVVDARTGRAIGEGIKTSPGADLTAKDRQTREAKYPQAKMAVTTFESKSNTLAKDLETLANHPGLNGISGLINGRTMAVTGPARQALSLYNSIVARGGFKELADMRASSPTGGALGNVSNQEGQYLRDAFAPIDRTQDTSDLANSLKTAAEAVRGSAGRVREAFDTTYEYRAGQSDRPAASGGLLNSGNRKSLTELLK